jgi:hypothetical protein
VKYPKRIKYRGRVLATIYAKCKGRDSYRVAWQVAGQRRMASFPSYSLAKRHADGLVKDLAKGSQVTALHPAQLCGQKSLRALRSLRLKGFGSSAASPHLVAFSVFFCGWIESVSTRVHPWLKPLRLLRLFCRVPHLFLFLLQPGSERFALLDQLLLEQLDFLGISRRRGLYDFIPQRDFALGDFRGVFGIQLRELFFLRAGEFDGGRGLAEPFHGEFVGGLHSI